MTPSVNGSAALAGFRLSLCLHLCECCINVFVAHRADVVRGDSAAVGHMLRPDRLALVDPFGSFLQASTLKTSQMDGGVTTVKATHMAHLVGLHDLANLGRGAQQELCQDGRNERAGCRELRMQNGPRWV